MIFLTMVPLSRMSCKSRKADSGIFLGPTFDKEEDDSGEVS